MKYKLSDKSLLAAAKCLRVLSHPVRLKIIQVIAPKEHTVGELADLCGVAHNVASTHLKLLERCGFISSDRKGQNVYYGLIDEHLLDLMSCMQRRFSNRGR